MPKFRVRYWSKSEILTIKEYWNLIGWEPFLAITWEPDFSQACSFCRMLMNHKNFHFTKLPDKNDDVIFLKSPKAMFWAIFGHFCLMEIFSKNLALPHTTIYEPLTSCQVSEKTNELILRKLTDRWKDGWLRRKDGHCRQTLPTHCQGKLKNPEFALTFYCQQT